MSRTDDVVDVLRYPDGRVVAVPAGDGRIVAAADAAGRADDARRLGVSVALLAVLGYALLVVNNLLYGVVAASLLYVVFRSAGVTGDDAGPTLLAEDAPADAAAEVFDVDARYGHEFAEERHAATEREPR
ncbi:hypothetical protein [Halobaculum lipolyticum]|uniref:Uncharacterized protein n=1 Tax=Halobaculum lipolyticum TaxID=3032001 RepID=A0ABD5W9H3_9EURY|nr:hypothetical protein [Halobaculum sp. DT31]